MKNNITFCGAGHEGPNPTLIVYLRPLGCCRSRVVWWLPRGVVVNGEVVVNEWCVVVFVNLSSSSSWLLSTREVLTLVCGWWWLSSTCGVVEGNDRRVDTSPSSRINCPDRSCHRPVTRQNGDGNVTGDFFLTRPRPRDSRTRDPARVSIPVSITKNNIIKSRWPLSTNWQRDSHSNNTHFQTLF